MHWSTAAAILAVAPSIALAQTPNNPPAAQNVVTVGQAGNLAFVPNSLTMNQGEKLTFLFMSAAHSVASTSMTRPNVADNAFFSGPIPVDKTVPTPQGSKVPGSNRRRMHIARSLRQQNNVVDLKTRQAALLPNAPTFTITMNTIGMQAFICDQAAHAANGMILMVNVVPAAQGATGAPPNTTQQNNANVKSNAQNGTSPPRGGTQKRQNPNDVILQNALVGYLSVGQSVTTVKATALPGTGGVLSAQAQSLLANGGSAVNQNPAGATPPTSPAAPPPPPAAAPATPPPPPPAGGGNGGNGGGNGGNGANTPPPAPPAPPPANNNAAAGGGGKKKGKGGGGTGTAAGILSDVATLLGTIV